MARATRVKLVGLGNSLGLVALGMVVAHTARCTPAPSSMDAGVDPAEQRRVLESIATRVIVPAHERFVDAARELERRAQAAATSGADPDRVAAQDAWREAMSRWQRVEVLQLGPAADASTPGGRALRDDIYSWPTTSPCRTDQELVEQAYRDPDAFARQLVNVRGLDAMEYLLFYEGADNGCSALSPLNTDGTWAALGEAELRTRRAAYAATLAILVRRDAEALSDAWAPSGGDFAAELAGAGTMSTIYTTARHALNRLTDAMFYLDLTTKDAKLGTPAGILRCPSTTCPEAVESPFAGASRENIAENLRGFRAVFLGEEPGSEGLGIDDLLVAVGEEALVRQLDADLAGAIASVEAIEGSLEHALSADLESVLAAHRAVKAVTDTLKGRLLTILSLEVPAEGAGDTD